MRCFEISKKNWIVGISDGLTLPCAICKKKVYWDYTIKDKTWNKIIPKEIRRDVICLPCLDKLAEEKGVDIASSIESVQFTGINFTVEFVPANVFIIKED